MPSSRKRLDLNTCTVEQLEFVEGMTRPLAKRIVAYRKRAGYFKTISELGNVRGIGDRMLSLISKHVDVLPSSPRRSRRSSLVSSRASSPRRGRSRRSVSRVSFSSSRHSSPIRKKSPKGEVVRPTRRSERVLSRSSLSRRSSRSSPSLRGSPRRRTSPKRKANLKQNRLAKKDSKSPIRNGPVYVDSAQNVSIDLGKLAKEGCNLTLHGSASKGQSCPLLTINVKELDGPCPSLGLSLPSPGHPIVEQQQSSSPEHPTQGSSVVDENIREYLVIRDTKRKTETFSEDPATMDLVAKKSHGLSPKKGSPRKIKNRRDRSGDYHKKSRSRSRSRSRSSSPKKASLRRSRSGSRKYSPPRSRRRHESPANDGLSRSDIENWLQEGSAPLRGARGGVNAPLASSTPRRRRDRRERRSLSPTTGRDVAGPSRIENDRRNEPVVVNRPSPKEGRHFAVQDGRRSKKENQSGRWEEKRESGSTRRKLDLDDNDGNARGRRRLDTENIDQGMENMDRSRSRSRGRRAFNRPEEEDNDAGDDEQVRRHRRREPRHRSKTDRDSRRRKREETDSYAIGSWCSVL